MGKSSPTCDFGVSRHEIISGRGIIWSYKPGSSLRYINTFKYRRRLRTARRPRAYAIPLLAMGSANELEYQILLARDLGFLNLVVYQTVNTEIVGVKRMLASLIRELESKERRRVSPKQNVFAPTHAK